MVAHAAILGLMKSGVGVWHRVTWACVLGAKGCADNAAKASARCAAMSIAPTGVDAQHASPWIYGETNDGVSRRIGDRDDVGAERRRLATPGDR